MEDKNPWNGYEKPSFTSLTYQMFRCSIICTSLTPWIPQLALPSPSKQCWDEETLLGQGKVYRGAQTTTLLGGEVEKLRQIVLIVLRILSSIVARFSVVASQTWEATPMKIKCLPLNSFKKEYKLKFPGLRMFTSKNFPYSGIRITFRGAT